jgi:carbon-monoxide dehydrogenase medium subunit
MLKETVEAMASIQIRNMATVGGNLCNASPAADTATALIALGAEAWITGVSGERVLPLEELFLGPGETVLETGELLKGVFIPDTEEASGACFLKVGRTKLDIATVNVAVYITLRDGVVEGSRIVLGAVAPVPLRLPSAEASLLGKKPTPEGFIEVAGICCANIEPITDVRASAEYRIAVAEALVRDALAISCQRAGGD